MNVAIMGAAGFIGTNLVLGLLKDQTNKITVVDEKKEYFVHYSEVVASKLNVIELSFNNEADFDQCTKNQDIVYHLISTINPSTSNQNIGKELADNILLTIHLLESCVKNGVSKVIFISSGGTVYGKDAVCPIIESSKTQPINTYGIQKLTIEKLLYLYNHIHGLDYCIIRLSNPFGPYQRPNGKLGAITTFIYNALHQKKIYVYGDGSVVRDYIYISDAIQAILNIAQKNTKHHVYNVGSGVGISINEILNIIECDLGLNTDVEYIEARNVDVAVNYLDISRYETEFGKLQSVSLKDGMRQTKEFLKGGGL